MEEVEEEMDPPPTRIIPIPVQPVSSCRPPTHTSTSKSSGTPLGFKVNGWFAYLLPEGGGVQLKQHAHPGGSASGFNSVQVAVTLTNHIDPTASLTTPPAPHRTKPPPSSSRPASRHKRLRKGGGVQLKLRAHPGGSASGFNTVQVPVSLTRTHHIDSTASLTPTSTTAPVPPAAAADPTPIITGVVSGEAAQRVLSDHSVNFKSSPPLTGLKTSPSAHVPPSASPLTTPPAPHRTKRPPSSSSRPAAPHKRLRQGCPADVQQLSLSKEEVPPEQQERSPSLDQQDPAEPPHIKEEQEDLWTSQEGEQLPGLQEADGTKVPFTPVPVKSEEEDEEKPQSSQLHQRLPEHMETGAAGEDCGGPGPARDSEPDSHLHPDAGDRTGESSETAVSCDEETREPQSGLNSLKMNNTPVSDVYNTDKKLVSCSECGKRLKKENLKAHKRVHSGEKPFSCSVCGKRYAESGSVRKHMVLHTGKKPYSCSVCDKRFTWSNQVKNHQCAGRQASQLHQSQTEHMETGAAGEDCGGPGPARDSEPDSHLHPDAEEKTGDSSEPETEDSEDDETTREPQSGLNSLKMNNTPVSDVYNTDKKLVSCSECGKRLKKENLKAHKRVHSGEKPFSCSVCGKRYAESGSVRKHMVLHTEDCGGPEPARNSDPDSHLHSDTDDRTDDSSVAEIEVMCDDWEETREPQSDTHLRSETDDGSSDSSKTDDSMDSDFWKDNRKPQLRLSSLKVNKISDSDRGCGSGKKSSSGSDYKASETLEPESDDSVDSDFWKDTRKPRFKSKSLENNEVSKRVRGCVPGKKAFSCSECGQEVVCKESLKIHMRVHTGEKPFSCFECGTSFAWSYQVKSHKCAADLTKQDFSLGFLKK